MNEIVIDGPEDLRVKLMSSNQYIDPQQHGPIFEFLSHAKMMADPNACSCKKGRSAREKLNRLYMSIPSSVRFEPLYTKFKGLLGEGVIVFKLEGNEVARLR